jgi:hypothetical protein
MKQNFFATLGEALDAVREFLISTNSSLANPEELFNRFLFGGVSYGETKHAAALLSIHRGKVISGRMAKRGVSLTVYRMDSGTYEAVCYIS